MDKSIDKIVLNARIEHMVNQLNELKQKLRQLNTEKEDLQSYFIATYFDKYSNVELLQGGTLGQIETKKGVPVLKYIAIPRTDLDKPKFKIENPQAFGIYESYLKERFIKQLR